MSRFQSSIGRAGEYLVEARYMRREKGGHVSALSSAIGGQHTLEIRQSNIFGCRFAMSNEQKQPCRNRCLD